MVQDDEGKVIINDPKKASGKISSWPAGLRVFAVLIFAEETEIQVNMPRTFLPRGCEEGDIVTFAFERDEAVPPGAQRCASDHLKKLIRGKKPVFPYTQSHTIQPNLYTFLRSNGTYGALSKTPACRRIKNVQDLFVQLLS